MYPFNDHDIKEAEEVDKKNASLCVSERVQYI
jgi:hypothetical protein